MLPFSLLHRSQIEHFARPGKLFKDSRSPALRHGFFVFVRTISTVACAFRKFISVRATQKNPLKMAQSDWLLLREKET